MGYWNENLFNKQHHGHVTWTAHTAATKLQTWNSFSLQDVLLQWHRAYPVLNPGKLMRPPVSAFKALMTSQWESVISSTSAKHTQTDTYWNAKENREQALRGCITAGTCKSLNWFFWNENPDIWVRWKGRENLLQAANTARSGERKSFCKVKIQAYMKEPLFETSSSWFLICCKHSVLLTQRGKEIRGPGAVLKRFPPSSTKKELTKLGSTKKVLWYPNA